MLILAGKSIVLYVVVVCDFVFFVVSLALGFEFVVCVWWLCLCSSMLHLICFSGCVIVSSVSPSRWFSGFSETDSWSWSWSWCYGFYFVGFTRWMGVQIVSAEFDWDAIVLGFIAVSISALLILNFLFSTCFSIVSLESGLEIRNISRDHLPIALSIWYPVLTFSTLVRSFLQCDRNTLAFACLDDLCCDFISLVFMDCFFCTTTGGGCLY